MSKNRPFFITGATAKIKINGKTMAFCSDFSYSVQILTQTPKILGMYEGSSVEPLGYSVSGSFTIIRYAKDAKAGVGSAPNSIAANDAGNGTGNWGAAWGKGLGSSVTGSLGLGNDGRADEALNPGKFQQGTTFDIQVYQKVPLTVKDTTDIVTSISNFAAGEKSEGFAAKGKGDIIGVANIRNCRITAADFSLTKKGAAVQKFNFVALYVDEDSFAADFSGLGQHFQG